jgi:hypothetical protein
MYLVTESADETGVRDYPATDVCPLPAGNIHLPHKCPDYDQYIGMGIPIVGWDGD